MRNKARELRDYQDAGFHQLLAALAEGKRPLYVLSGGGGKTRVAAEVIEQYRRAGKRVLILVHHRELLEQMWNALVDDIGLDEASVGVIWGQDKKPRKNPDAPIQIASIDTLLTRKRMKRPGWMPAADLLVLDEAHHAAATKWQEVLCWYPEAKRLGLTATPFRFDRLPLSVAFDTIVQGPSMEELFKHPEYPLTSPNLFVPAKDGVNLKGLRRSQVNGRDWYPAQLGVRMGKKAIVANVVEHLLRRATTKGLRAILYVPTLKNARKYVDAIKAAGEHRVAYLDASTPLAYREQLLKPDGLLDTGEVMIVVNCEVLTEGWDLPSVKCVAMARPTDSPGLYLQMVARALRTWVKKGDILQTVPVILDFAGNVRRHDVPWADRAISLDDDGKARGNRMPPTYWICESCVDGLECGAVNALGWTTCSVCGDRRPESVREVEEQHGLSLRAAELPLTTEQREELVQKILALAKQRLRRDMPRAFAERAVDAGLRL